MTDSKVDLTFAIKQKCTFTNTPRLANCSLISIPQVPACKETYLGLFLILIHKVVVTKLILCTLLPIEPTMGEIISFDLLEGKRGEVDLSKRRFYSKPWLFRPLNGFS